MSREFGRDYFCQPIPELDGKSMWEDNTDHWNAARCAHLFLSLERRPCATVLDVGCGRGWAVKHLRDMGRVAVGCDYSGYAIKHSVCAAMLCDLNRKLPFVDESFDLVTCLGVMDYLLPDRLNIAVSELTRVSRKYLWTSILVHADVEVDQIVQPPDEWVPLFVDAGWVPIQIEGLFEAFGYNESVYEWHQLWEKQDPDDGYGFELSVTDRTEPQLERQFVLRRLQNRIERWIYYDRLRRRKRGELIPEDAWYV